MDHPANERGMDDKGKRTHLRLPLRISLNRDFRGGRGGERGGDTLDTSWILSSIPNFTLTGRRAIGGRLDGGGNFSHGRNFLVKRARELSALMRSKSRVA